MSYFNNLDPADLVTLIGIIFTLIIGLFNLSISLHKNHMDIITQNRIEWVKTVRDITSEIISWRYNESLKDLLKNINKLVLHLNVSNEIDNKVISELFEMYDSAYKLSFYDGVNSESAKKIYTAYYSHKQSINTLMRIYLKKEWTRIKVESHIFHIPFRKYWIPFLGFSEKWATNSLKDKYDKVKTYEFRPWLNFTDSEIKEISDVFDIKAYQLPTEHSEKDVRRKQLRDALLSNSTVALSSEGSRETDCTSRENCENDKKGIKVPDGKFA